MTPKPPPRLHPSEVDRTIREPVRLGAMSILCAGYQADFSFLKEALGATDGNLAAHLRTLEEAGYVEATKSSWAGVPTPYTSYSRGERGLRGLQQDDAQGVAG